MLSSVTSAITRIPRPSVASVATAVTQQQCLPNVSTDIATTTSYFLTMNSSIIEPKIYPIYMHWRID